jgi:hypothetical protein
MSQTKEELLKQLTELEELEKKVQSKKSVLKYKEMDVPIK